VSPRPRLQEAQRAGEVGRPERLASRQRATVFVPDVTQRPVVDRRGRLVEGDEVQSRPSVGEATELPEMREEAIDLGVEVDRPRRRRVELSNNTVSPPIGAR
jgi:hypothetical protein